MTEPDFEEWASIQFPKLSHIDRYRIANYLAQSFEQGYYLGLSQGWAIEQGKEYADKEGV